MSEKLSEMIAIRRESMMMLVRAAQKTKRSQMVTGWVVEEKESVSMSPRQMR